jgi:predicted DCC family thiol-disulfide oxidoreductase YuxK
MSSSPTQSPQYSENLQRSPFWQIKLLYDGECPLCLREVNFLQKQDAGRGLVVFVDIADENYNPQEHGDISFEEAMGRIHAVLSDGTIVKNVEVFRRVYSILGIGWIYAFTKWPLIGSLVDLIYEVWAAWRLALTGRPDLQTILAARQKSQQCNSPNRCQIINEGRRQEAEGKRQNL